MILSCAIVAVFRRLLPLERAVSYFRDKDLEWVQNVSIVASNDINEETIMSLNEQSVIPIASFDGLYVNSAVV